MTFVQDQGLRYNVVGGGGSTDLTAVNSALSALSGAVTASGGASALAVSSGLAGTSASISSVSANLSSVSASISSLQASVENSGNLTTVNSSLSGTSSSLSATSSALSNVSSSVAVLSSGLAINSDNISSVSTNLSSVSAALVAVAANVVSGANLSAISNNLSNVSDSISAVNTSLSSISSSVSNVSSTLRLVSSNISFLSSNLSTVSSSLSDIQINFIKHVEADKINLAYRGIKPNDTTPATVTSNTAILQAAINESVATGKSIAGVNGLISVAEVTYNGAFSIYGEHMTKSGFKAMAADKNVFTATNDCQSTIGLTFSNLYFEGVNASRAGWDGLFKGRTGLVLTANEGGSVATAANRGIFIEKCQFKHFGGYALDITDTFNSSIKDCYFLYNGKQPTGAAQFTSAATPIYADGGIGALGGGVFLHEENWTDVGTTNFDFSNNYFGGCNIGVFGGKEAKDQNIGVNFRNCIFEANNYGRYAARTSRETFDGCYFEGNLIKAAVGGAGHFNNTYQYPLTQNTTDAYDYYTVVDNGFIKTKYVSDGVTALEIDYSDTLQQVTELKAASGAIKLGKFGNARLYSGQGTPEGVVSAGVGSEYLDTDATSLATLKYFKTSGTGNTGWSSIAATSSVDVKLLTAPANNGTYTIASSLPEVHVFLDTVNSIQDYQIIMPSSGPNGQAIYFHTKGGGSVKNLNINGAGATLYGGPFTLNQNSTISFVKNGNDPSWYLNDNQFKFSTASLPNQTGTAGEYEILAGTVDQYNGVKITQTTPNINFKMPVVSGGFEKTFIIENSVSSTVNITAYGVVIKPDTYATFFFNGFTWLAEVARENKKVYQYHTSGASVTVGKDTDILVVDPAAVLPALAITLDDRSLKANKEVYILFGGTIAANAPVVNALTINAPAGQSVLENLILASANSGNTLHYILNPQNSKHARIN
jgi:hypothetical protein